MTGINEAGMTALFQQLRTTLEALPKSDGSADFYLADAVAPAEGPYEGFEVLLKHKFSYQHMIARFFRIPGEAIEKVNPNRLEPMARLVFCFDSDCIKSGFDSGGVFQVRELLVGNIAINDLLDRSYPIPVYNLVYAGQNDFPEEKSKWLFSQSVFRTRLLDGKALAIYINDGPKDLLLYRYFLDLPTLLVDKHFPSLKILTC